MTTEFILSQVFIILNYCFYAVTFLVKKRNAAKNSWLAMLIGLVTSLITAAISAPFIYWYSVNSAWFVLLIMWIIVLMIQKVLNG